MKATSGLNRTLPSSADLPAVDFPAVTAEPAARPLVAGKGLLTVAGVAERAIAAGERYTKVLFLAVEAGFAFPALRNPPGENAELLCGVLIGVALLLLVNGELGTGPDNDSACGSTVLLPPLLLGERRRLWTL